MIYGIVDHYRKTKQIYGWSIYSIINFIIVKNDVYERVI